MKIPSANFPLGAVVRHWHAIELRECQQFGIDVLKWLAKRDLKSKAGKSAKNKLKSVGV